MGLRSTTRKVSSLQKENDRTMTSHAEMAVQDEGIGGIDGSRVKKLVYDRLDGGSQ
jgi:hypothetical protein